MRQHREEKGTQVSNLVKWDPARAALSRGWPG
jgi:hypothetical protein